MAPNLSLLAVSNKKAVSPSYLDWSPGQLNADFGKALKNAANTNVNSNMFFGSMASVDELGAEGKEIACGSPTGSCTSKFDAKAWTSYMIKSPYRDPKRINNPKFNASDLAHFHKRYGNAFATLCAMDGDKYNIRIWAYKGLKKAVNSLDALRGVSEQGLPLEEYSSDIPKEIQFDVKRLNAQTDMLNTNNPLEISAETIVSSAFERMTGSATGLANAKQYMDYMTGSQEIAENLELLNEL